MNYNECGGCSGNGVNYGGTAVNAGAAYAAGGTCYGNAQNRQGNQKSAGKYGNIAVDFLSLAFSNVFFHAFLHFLQCIVILKKRKELL